MTFAARSRTLLAIRRGEVFRVKMKMTSCDWERLLLAIILCVMAMLYLMEPMWSVR
jgi:hypothetical protein